MDLNRDFIPSNKPRKARRRCLWRGRWGYLTPGQAGEGSRLGWALTISLLAHGLVLAPGPSGWGERAGARPQNAALRVSWQGQPRDRAPASPSPSSTIAPSTSPDRLLTGKGGESRVRAAEEPAGHSADPALGRLTPVVNAADGREGQTPGPARTMAPRQSGEGLDGNALRGLSMAIARQARVSGMPRPAAPMGAGRAEIRVVFGALTPQARLERSSGNSQWDAWALGLISESVAQVSLPPALVGEEFELLLPVLVGD